MTFFGKIKNKKGFTLVELIVVIAIMGIIVAMILPTLNQDNAKINDANARSKAFFTGMQNLYTTYSLEINEQNLKITDVPMTTDTDKYVMIVAQAINAGFSRVRTRISAETDVHVAFKTLLTSFNSADPETTADTKLKNDLTVALPQIKEGFYYAKVDNKGRVEIVHFKQFNFNDFDSSKSFIDDNMTLEGVVGAFFEDLPKSDGTRYKNKIGYRNSFLFKGTDI